MMGEVVVIVMCGVTVMTEIVTIGQMVVVMKIMVMIGRMGVIS